MGNIDSMRFTLGRNTFIFSGEANEPEVYVRLGFDILTRDEHYVVQYFNNVNVGTGTAVVSFIGVYSDYVGTKELHFEIEPLSINNATVTSGEPDEYGCYNLDNLKVTIGINELIEGVDYKIKRYFKEEENNYEITSVVVTAISKNYIEDAMGRFRTKIINPNLKDINDISITYPKTDIYYNGNPKKLALILMDNDYELIENKDYTLKYSDDITNAGDKKVIITGIGENYFGSKSIDYKILPLNINSGILSCGATDKNGNYNTDNITVSFRSKILQKNKDYSYNIEINSTEKFVLATVTVNGINNYEGTLQKVFRIGLSTIDISTVEITLAEDRYSYTGSLIQPEVITDLEYDVDYTITYPKYSIVCGEYKVIVNGKGKYSGLVELPFYILSKSIETAEISFGVPDANNCYNIKNIVVKLSGATLRLFIDYNYDISEVEIDNGYLESTLHVYGIGNFEGSKVVNVLTGRKMLYPGKNITLEKTAIYTRYNSQVAETYKTGKYYIWSAEEKDGKVRVTSNKEYVGQPGLITGWINLEDIFSSDNFKIGNKVIVNGEINTYADGTGNTINKRNEAMYIVDILDPDQYIYCYGVASGLNRARHGWATKDMVKRID